MASSMQKSSSLLSLYLTDTPISVEPNVPKIHLNEESASLNESPKKAGQKGPDPGFSQGQTPVDHFSRETSHHQGQAVISPVQRAQSPQSPVSYVSLAPNGQRADCLSPRPGVGRTLSVNSYRSTGNASTVSTVNSLYSSVHSLSDDEDLDYQSIRSKMGAMTVGTQENNTKHTFKNLLRKKEETKVPLTKEELFFHQVQDTLKNHNYAYEKKSTLEVNYLESCEIFLFGSPLRELFPTERELLGYLLQSSYELGEVRFSNLSRFHDVKSNQYPVEQLLRELLPSITRFSQVLDLYAESKQNINRPELFEVFSNYANNINGGLCIPLAISMFGNWLLTYNKDSALHSNYENPLILDYFRKAGRLSLVMLKCKPMFERATSSFSKSELIELSRFWGKDNLNSLSVTLYGLGEYYQFIHEYDLATTLWEMNCRLTSDADSGNLAVLGLTDGFGYGNRIKHRNRLGKRSKTDRYNTKRRIAHIYRILMKNPHFDEYGVSWATKDKYD